MSQKKENKPCNQFEQGQGKQKKARSPAAGERQEQPHRRRWKQQQRRSGWNLRPNGKTRGIRENGFPAGFFRGLDEGVGGIQFSPGLGGAELEQVVAGDRAQLCCKGAGGTGLYGDAGLRVFVQGDEDGCAMPRFFTWMGQPGPVVRGKTPL